MGFRRRCERKPAYWRPRKSVTQMVIEIGRDQPQGCLEQANTMRPYYDRTRDGRACNAEKEVDDAEVLRSEHVVLFVLMVNFVVLVQ